jgi:ERCC4-related helicase
MTFRNHSELNRIYTELQNLFDLSQVSSQQRRTTSLQIAHPKLAKLRECVVEHFQTFERTKVKGNDQTRVIIFSEKRDSVREIADLLEQDRPLVKPMAFIGQASSHAAGRRSIVDCVHSGLRLRTIDCIQRVSIRNCKRKSSMTFESAATMFLLRHRSVKKAWTLAVLI